MSQKNPYYLTSEIIQTRADGHYGYHFKAVLITHEAIRRELNRGANAMKRIMTSEKKKDWHIKYFSEWFQHVLAPVIHNFHTAEKVFFDYYTAQGVEVPPNLAEDHINISSIILDLERLDDVIRPYIEVIYLSILS